MTKPLPPVADLLRDFHSGARTPESLARECFAAIDRLDADINALPTRVDRDTVLAAAERAGKAIRAGDAVGALAGLPYAAKDMHRTAGIRTTFGSPIFADHVPDRNDAVVQRVLDAGAILIAKSNTPEFAAGGQTFNPVFGRTANPHDTTRTSGGSSGGGAAAVATGMTVVADGSDLGASLRNPAAFCGVVGLRPSSVSNPALLPDANGFNTMNTVGTMAPRVADLRWNNRAIHAPMAARPIAAWLDAIEQEAAARRHAAGQRPLRLAFTIDAGGAMPVAAPVRRALERAIERLREHARAGRVELVEAFPDMSDADDCFQVLRAQYFVENLGELYRSDRARMKDTVAWNVEQGLALTPERLAAAAATRSRIFARIAAFLGGFDAWLLPTVQVLPFSHEIPFPTEIDGVPLATYIDWVKSCYWITVSGHPGLSIPAGFEADPADPAKTPLPVGLQLVGHYGRDEALLDVGERIEALLAG
ncbi:amidase family protein [Burkholderiaceae bacterium FT117]|uniref:amidase n=1 Tax=Zeimonas sediminis TaxID=2944268 RepID=UPI002342EF70|nr:amidase family protein [Zeimonas sediminis]MCM5570200.1 amidase family protein [Zeimonas sediminis]